MARYDTTKDPLGQIDADTKTTWSELNAAEIDWLYSWILGRTPFPGEVEAQIAHGKSIKGFIHGAQEELDARAKAGDTEAKRAKLNIEQWEEQNRHTLFGSLADLTGLKELENPFGTLADWTGVKEIEKWGPVALQVGATLFGGPAAGLAASAVVNATRGDAGDVLGNLAFDYIGQSFAGKSVLGAAATQMAQDIAMDNVDLPDAAFAAMGRIGGDFADVTYNPVIPGVRNSTIADAAVSWALTKKNEHALFLVGVDLLDNKIGLNAGKPAPPASNKDPFMKWLQTDAKGAWSHIHGVPQRAKQSVSNATETIRNMVGSQSTNPKSKKYDPYARMPKSLGEEPS